MYEDSVHVMESFFFFQAEDRIRDLLVTGVQTCALPIWEPRVSCLNPRKTSRDLLQHVSRPHSPTISSCSSSHRTAAPRPRLTPSGSTGCMRTTGRAECSWC